MENKSNNKSSWPPAVDTINLRSGRSGLSKEVLFSYACLLCGLASILYTLVINVGIFRPFCSSSPARTWYLSSTFVGSFFCCFLGVVQILISLVAFWRQRRNPPIRFLSIAVDVLTFGFVYYFFMEFVFCAA